MADLASFVRDYRRREILGALTASAALWPAGLRAQNATSDDQAVAEGANALGDRLLRRRTSAQAARNAVISPLSIAMALSMVAEGARNATLRSLRSGLGQARLTGDAASSANERLRRRLVADAGEALKLRIANSLWLKNDWAPRPEFVARLRQAYDAEAERLNFAAPEAVARVNDWTSRATERMIPRLFDRFRPDLRAVLVNAIWFKGLWSTPFPADATRPGPFRLSGGAPAQVPLMKASLTTSYAERGGIHAVLLPYRGDAFEAVVMTSRAVDGTATLLAEGARGGWPALVRGLRFTRRTGDVTLPRLRINFRQDIKSDLAATGFAEALASNADFRGITNENLAIDQIVHGTALELNEEGTEAAAATGVTMAPTAVAPPTQPFDFRADRPFLLAVRHRASNAILFLGWITDPR